MRVLVTGDTHVPDFTRALPPGLDPHLEWAEVILHTGDATSAATLEQLAISAPVHAALGNIDPPEVADWGARPEVELVLDGVPVAIVHDAGPRRGREARLRGRFPRARVVAFGHSHDPLVEEHDGVLLLNPGSPTWKRRAPRPTVIRMETARGEVRAELVDLASDRPRSR